MCFHSIFHSLWDAEIMSNLEMLHQLLFLYEECCAFRALENTGSKLFGTLTEMLK